MKKSVHKTVKESTQGPWPQAEELSLKSRVQILFEQR